MKTVSIDSSKQYNIHIERGLLKKAGSLISQVHPRCKAAIVTDDNVARLYLSQVSAGLENAGYSLCTLILPHGEHSKSLGVWTKVLLFLA